MQPLGENPANTPAFLGKLWKMVNDPSTDDLICWSPSGTSFVIPNQAQFWYELLPLYYKHNNMSSFVRQLNMYGFHKISTVENGTMDSEKDEIQFSHPYFVRNKPELLRLIKRKGAATKATNENTNKGDDLTKVLNDVKQLRGRQTTVDNQLNAMKQENALLWREVAILRQKHIKQQKIVNKLIQFLVTLVQPSRMTVGVKRGYQLMLNESPTKKPNNGKNQNSNTEGPTIHELDNELDLTSNLYEDDIPVVTSPSVSSIAQQTDNKSPANGTEEAGPDQWDKPEFVILETSPEDLNFDQDENLISALETEPEILNNEKVFLNPSTQDTLLSNLIKSSTTNSKKPNTEPATSSNMTVAKRDANHVAELNKNAPSTSDDYSNGLNNHVESTQSEIEQFKDILNGCSSFDANTLLGLFNDDSPIYDLNVGLNEKNDNFSTESADPLVSGSKITPYSSNFDFTELLDDSLDGDNTTPVDLDILTSGVNTPQIHFDQPLFPIVKKDK